MRVLVCGGREFNDDRMLDRTLDDLHRRRPIACIIEGGASGADRLAGRWAFRSQVENETFFADWKRRGKAAGPLRNQEMINEGKPDLVIAFPGGRGTADMVRRAEAAGIEVVRPLPLSEMGAKR